MAVTVEEQQTEKPPVVNKQKEEPSNDDDDDSEEEEEEEEEEPVTKGSITQLQRAKMENLFHRLSTEKVALRVHDVLIKGNTKTKESLILAEVEDLLKSANTVQDLLQASSLANARLHRLEIFDSVNITLDSGPPELPGTANVVVEVVENKNPLTGDIGIFSKPEVENWIFNGAYEAL